MKSLLRRPRDTLFTVMEVLVVVFCWAFVIVVCSAQTKRPEPADCLVYSDRRNIGKFCVGDPDREETLLRLGGYNIVPVDVDFTHKCVYYADISTVNSSLEVVCLNQTTMTFSPPRIVRSSNFSKLEGIAYDWITDNVYWLEAGLRELGVTSNGRLTKVLYKGTEIFDKPRALAVHPGLGQLFWTDWSDVNPRIVRASMNGNQSSVTILAEGKEKFGWVNGIALDIPANMVYWADARKDNIGSMDMDGSKLKTFPAKSNSHVFSIAVSSEFIYWADWKDYKIHAVRKTNVANITAVKKFRSNLMGIALWTEKPTVTVDLSSATKCPYLWLLGHNSTSGGSYGQCYCPDGYNATYVNGQLECDKMNKTTEASTSAPAVTTSSPNSCTADHFSCGDQRCIPQRWRCDGDKDCPSGLDEKDCVASTCQVTEFKCDNLKCIPHQWVCDGAKDCQNGEDEQKCFGTCNKDQISCGSGKCIPARFACDGQKDCVDGSDEKNCTESRKGLECLPGEFNCRDEMCIPSVWVCDGVTECVNGADEANCSMYTTTTISTPITNSPRTTESAVRPEDCLLYTSRNELHRICLGNRTTSLLLKSRKVSVMDVDVDYAHRCIFYTAFDSNTYSLQEFCYQRWQKFTPVVNMSGTPDGLAYDWAGQNIYWLETTQKFLMVTDRNGRYRATLYSGHIFDEPRDLVLNPEKGDLFWADWSNTNPAIMQASMAGDPSSVRALVKTNLGWPNGLALDTKINQLYWTDGKLDKIMKFDLNANWMREVRDLYSFSHPFGIAVSDEFIYWTDWRNVSVFAVRKDAPKTSPIITVVQTKYTQKRVAIIPNKTKAPRWCSKVCPHLCLTSYNVTTREPDHVCRCADGFLPGKDSCGHPACLSKSTTTPMTTSKLCNGVRKRVPIYLC
ncbi:low-density lipoprotein receptor-related protein 4-like [Liolophura sinensis]|uniref:low-density lipoprotein receptor-related protein 4-like n=1 Tax=Liolophura sinensis TaxID=3198878 RepID=UPI0031580A99